MSTAFEIAMSNADADAIEARSLIIGMRSQRANIAVTLDALIDAVSDAEWADVDEVTNHLLFAQYALNNVFATKEKEA